MDVRSVYLTPTAAGINNLVHKVGNEKYLVGISLEETDNTLNCPACDGANLWIQDPVNNNAISLINGWMEGGSIGGWGCIPLKQGHEICGTVYHSTAGNQLKLNLMFSDAPSTMFGFTPKPLANAQVPHGRLKVIIVSGAAADAVLELQPALGYVWEVIDAWAYHDDGTARTLNWAYTDGTNTISKGATGTTASGVRFPFYVNSTSGWLGSQSTLTNSVYATCTASGMAAGNHMYLNALVREYAE